MVIFIEVDLLERNGGRSRGDEKRLHCIIRRFAGKWHSPLQAIRRRNAAVSRASSPGASRCIISRPWEFSTGRRVGILEDGTKIVARAAICATGVA
jgi:hypothetical protein